MGQTKSIAYALQARQAVCVIVTHDLHSKSCLTVSNESKHMAQYIRSPCTRARSLGYQQQQHSSASTSYTLVTHFTMLFVTSAFFDDTEFSMSLMDCSVSFCS